MPGGMPARQASQGLLAVVSASVGTHLAMHTFSKSQSMKKHVCHPWIVAAWLMLGQTVHAQAIDTTLDKYLVLQSQINASTCAVSFAQNGASGNLVVLLPPLKTTALNNDIFSPITRFDIDLKNQFTSILCDSNFNASMQLVFDGAMAAIAPRSGLLRNTALQRPAQNVFVQIGLIDALNCGNPARCFDINNVALTPSSTSGISLTTRITMRGTQANGTVCHDAPSLSSGTFTSNGVLQSVSLSLNANAKDCDKFVINVESVLTQEAVFSPSNTAKIILNPPTLQPASGFLTGPNQMGSKIFTLFPNSTNFIAASGTCALSLSNTNLNMGMVSPERISATPRNEVVMSKPLIMTVNNCTGFASGKNKVMQWVFTTPNSKDRTRMENALVTGGASGISAQ
ncbi:MAG: hypothetical protein EBT28_10410, partial [Betaproteobacteria bacterium]|nr:hypothetical protein [Betaproteobacteria bacterium]